MMNSYQIDERKEKVRGLWQQCQYEISEASTRMNSKNGKEEPEVRKGLKKEVWNLQVDM